MKSPFKSWRLWVSVPVLAVLGGTAATVHPLLFFPAIFIAWWWGWKIAEWDEMDRIEQQEKENRE